MPGPPQQERSPDLGSLRAARRADPPGADRPAVADLRWWDLRRLTVEVESSSGVGLVDARPGGALKLVAPEPEPIFVAQEVLVDAEAKAEGDSAEEILLG